MIKKLFVLIFFNFRLTENYIKLINNSTLLNLTTPSQPFQSGIQLVVPFKTYQIFHLETPSPPLEGDLGGQNVNYFIILSIILPDIPYI